ncbi:TonB family protein [Luteimonas sp. BDR2-5]|uniref:energy transducer TonB n=1 Tax=Proluteimonas luteida TaxID=2878685 RepID=UPI001E3BA268|nr:energy transducer TonB [Luteimonas sp. BDR2-5]MCD9028094.1 TonB family protein [Luteimonas sp. BDR2-5]
MVLQPHPSPRHHRDAEDDRPDPTRIIGLTGTLVFNAVLLLVLLIPATLPDAARPAHERKEEFRWIDPPALPPPPPPSLVRPAAPESVTPRPQPPAITPPAPVVVDTAAAMPSLPPIAATDATVPATATPASLPGIASDVPMTGIALQYAHAPAPDYPREALRRGAEGVVQLQVAVDAEGRPQDVRVHRSSGNRDLDQAALRHVLRHWTFQPAMRDGRPVPATGIVPIAFTLGRG